LISTIDLDTDGGIMRKYEPNRWKGFIIGTAGSIAGLLAMGYYWKAIAAIGEKSSPAKPEKRKKRSAEPDGGRLDDISLIGQQHRKSESSTDALGRIIYTFITGREPRSKETKKTLSNIVHWSYGMVMGGAYGAARGSAGIRDVVQGGLAFSTALWLFGDELAVPLLGLQAGPTAIEPVQHLHRLGAHLAYGLASTSVTQILNRATGEKS
jgi:hypothetical protein